MLNGDSSLRIWFIPHRPVSTNLLSPGLYSRPFWYFIFKNTENKYQELKCKKYNSFSLSFKASMSSDEGLISEPKSLLHKTSRNGALRPGYNCAQIIHPKIIFYLPYLFFITLYIYPGELSAPNPISNQ